MSSFSSSLGWAVAVLWVRLGRVSSCASLGGSAVRRSRLGCGLRGSVGFAAVAGGEGSGVLGTWSGLDLVFFFDWFPGELKAPRRLGMCRNFASRDFVSLE